MRGWIKLSRIPDDHWIAQDPQALAVWIRMLWLANYEDKTIRFNGVTVDLKRGDLIFGLSAFSEKSGVSVHSLRRILTHMQNDSMIRRQKTNKYSIISIVNYDKYQEATAKPTVKPAAKPTVKPATPKEYKENKKYIFSVEDMQAAEYIHKLITRIKPDIKTPNLESWANTIRLMVERDNRSHKKICEVFRFANQDDFWQANILSPSKLREQFDRLEIKMNAPEKSSSQQQNKTWEQMAQEGIDF